MKLIHIADLHLDSSMESNLPKPLAAKRRKELLSTFRRLVSFASENAVKGILIAGDFFDTDIISRETASAVYREISSNPKIDFFYLRGNHDNVGFFNRFENIPENLKPFSDVWKSYAYEADSGKKIVISGIELSKKNRHSLYQELHLREEDFNIVLLHGEVSDYKNEEKDENIELKALYHKHIDYLALGHIHEHRRGRLPERGEYCYSGCPEGRGFDETGEHGFVFLDINVEKMTYEASFIPFSKRRIYEVFVDISESHQMADVMQKIREEVAKEGVTGEDLVKVVLIGESLYEERPSVSEILERLSDDFYFVKVYDRVKQKINYEDYKMEASLKGEFVRLVMKKEDLDEDEKMEIIQLGLKALRGEDLVLCD